ncbi:LytTR family DNA-binding domain-containing protein [Haloimpatiens sp. FM7330]|uniref:LytTR family DNA-binding domain-containing protein n=1 Tax=Haloimpatiens sp. FM7330 TaxID=3298610 RepID=UPI003625F142
MKIDVQIDPSCEEVKITICTPEITEELQNILNSLKNSTKKHIVGTKNERIYIVNPEDILFFYSESKKVFAKTTKETYEIKEKLYKLEEDLKDSSFIRISKSVIANIDKIKNLEILFNGNMCANFINGQQEYISRRYVPKIKEYLKMGGN